MLRSIGCCCRGFSILQHSHGTCIYELDQNSLFEESDTTYVLSDFSGLSWNWVWRYLAMLPQLGTVRVAGYEKDAIIGISNSDGQEHKLIQFARPEQDIILLLERSTTKLELSSSFVWLVNSPRMHM